MSDYESGNGPGYQSILDGAQRIMRQSNVPERCMECPALTSRAVLWITNELLDLVEPPDPGAAAESAEMGAVIKNWAMRDLRAFPIGCAGPAPALPDSSVGLRTHCASPQLSRQVEGLQPEQNEE